MAYTEEQIIEHVEKALDSIEELYKGDITGGSNCITWKDYIKGCNGGKLANELIAELLIEKGIDNNFLKKKLIQIEREKSYNVRNEHVKDKSSLEKILCNGLIDCRLGRLGKVEDFEMPLKNEQADRHVKAVDMISINDEEESIYLIEFKHSKNDETLLRAIFEIATYYAKIKNPNKIVKDYGKEDYTLKKAVLVPWGCNAYNDLAELRNGKRPALSKLAKLLEVELYSLDFCVK